MILMLPEKWFSWNLLLDWRFKVARYTKAFILICYPKSKLNRKCQRSEMLSKPSFFTCFAHHASLIIVEHKHGCHLFSPTNGRNEFSVIDVGENWHSFEGTENVKAFRRLKIFGFQMTENIKFWGAWKYQVLRGLKILMFWENWIYEVLRGLKT